MSLSVSFRWRLRHCRCRDVVGARGRVSHRDDDRLARVLPEIQDALGISSLAVTPPPGELTSSTTATTLVSCAAWRRASASPSGVAVGCVPPRVLSAAAIVPSTGTTAIVDAPSPATYSSA